MNIRALVAEAVGTFVLVGMGSLGVGTAVVIGQNVGLFALLLIVPFAFGLGLMAAIAIAGDASGGHFNPAVTLAAVFDGRIKWVTGIAYAVAQAVGAFAASLFILLVLSSDFVKATVSDPVDLGTGVGPDRFIRAFSIEIVLTAIFVAVILSVAAKRPNQAFLVIPMTLVAIHFVGIPLSGASVNPIRSLAPAVVTGTYGGLWVYLTAPFLGSVIGWGLYRLLNPDAAEGDADADEDDVLAGIEEYDEDDELETA